MGSNLDFIKKAQQYAKAHPSIIEVSTITQNSFTVIYRIYLPGKYDIIGETELGIKKEEPVKFVFPEEFPLKAPEINLRDDFNRDYFPHINPSKEKVIPCIYDGDLSELLQQPNWFDNILNQMVDWFDKASQESLMNYEQGWEIMRQDDFNGFHIDNIDLVKNKFKNDSTPFYKTAKVVHSKDNRYYSCVTTAESMRSDSDSYVLYFASELGSTQNHYFVHNITNFADLRHLAERSNIINFANVMNTNYKKQKKKIIIVSLNFRRPCNLIDSDTNIETFFYALEIKEQKRNEKIHQKSIVYMLSSLDYADYNKYRKLSGTIITSEKCIVQLGLGSLGSKVNLHLARNGNKNFKLIDNDVFLTHNNARHALMGGFFTNKAEFQKLALSSMSISANHIPKDILKCKNTDINGDLIIDCTAKISVRNYLASKQNNIPVIHTALYNKSRMGLLLSESQGRNPRIDDLVCSVYQNCIQDDFLRESLFNEQNARTSIGGGCSSYTTICSDSRISLLAAGMSSKIQYYISNTLPETGEINIGIVSDDDMSVKWKKISSCKVKILPSVDNEYEVRLFDSVVMQMEAISKENTPNEYGGVLIGNISLVNKTITVTSLIEAPDDSESTPVYFKLGKNGLKSKVKTIEKKTNGLITYLGTWHSHPKGGSASSIDKNTKIKILILRDYEPTICLIWTPNGIIRV